MPKELLFILLLNIPMFGLCIYALFKAPDVKADQLNDDAAMWRQVSRASYDLMFHPNRLVKGPVGPQGTKGPQGVQGPQLNWRK